VTVDRTTLTYDVRQLKIAEGARNSTWQQN